MNQESKNKKVNINRKRTLTRLVAVQILYQYHFFEGKKALSQINSDVVDNYVLSEEEDLSSYKNKIDQDFLNDLIAGSIAAEGLEEEIAAFLNERYSFESIDSVMKQILLLAAFELKFMLNTPFKVIIAEYVDITAGFFDEKKVTFVNAILENLAKKLRTI